jgi:hypothetical protein
MRDREGRMACRISPPGPMTKQSEWVAKSRGVGSTQRSAGKVMVVKQFPNVIPVGNLGTKQEFE